MNVKALAIHLGELRVGVLFQYAPPGAEVINRFVADDAFARLPNAPLLSARFVASTREDQRALWANVRSPEFNGRHSQRTGALLPAFFQNLLPEGVFRDHVAALRGCDPSDHFEMLAACGLDLPGKVVARPVVLSRDELAHDVTQDNDALEMSVTADPLEDGVSLSGVQPKIAVIRQGERYVGRTKAQDTHIIAKLPVVGQPRLPEVEALSLQLAAAAGVDACQAYLEPLSKLAVEHGYDLGDADAATNFLAVIRYDRAPGQRVHCEDMAQVLGVMPEDKYTGASYLNVAGALMSFPSLGEPAVHELLRRMAVNELLGNPDMHLKNIGLHYPDGVTPQLPPAYDIVAYAAFGKRSGHALRLLPDDDRVARSAGRPRAGSAPADKPSLTPALLREFCARLGIAEKPASTSIRLCVRAAVDSWPGMIRSSPLTERQKTQLSAHFNAHPWVLQWAARKKPAVPRAAP